MTCLSAENLSKSFGIKKLFEGITFGLSKGDKTALVAPNGTGKSTLLKVLAGMEPPDSGEVMTRSGLRVSFLEQEPRLDPGKTIREYIASSDSRTAETVQQYENAARRQAEDFNEANQKAFEEALAAMDAENAWDYEQRMKQILGKLDIQDLDQPIASLSGGERKRVALAFTLIENPDLLLLDEPTNHLDVEMVEWLENWLVQSNLTLLMITHDRYFLDRVCTHIIEIDRGKLYHHKGNYSYYLEKKAERETVEQTEIHKAGRLMKKELEWMRRSPKARTTKSKSRISAFYDTQAKASQSLPDSELRMEVNMKRMGTRILEFKNVDKRFGDTVILDNFSYSFSRGERIGIIGRNGTGKSTFLNLLTGNMNPDSGTVSSGETIEFGYYRQKGIELDESLRVIEVIKEIADVIKMADGSVLSAGKFLEYFMFPPEMQYTPVEKLSGGERRRLGLLLVLMKNPNFLILDEPTNDLDLFTLNRLEEFLTGFGGCLILVSHDRFFMDKLVHHYFVFEGEGEINRHHGTYAEYRELKEARITEEKARQAEQKKSARERDDTGNAGKKKEKTGLSFKERKEFNALEGEIEKLEQQKTALEAEMSAGDLDYETLQKKSDEYREIEERIEQKSMRWLELGELAED